MLTMLLLLILCAMALVLDVLTGRMHWHDFLFGLTLGAALMGALIVLVPAVLCAPWQLYGLLRRHLPPDPPGVQAPGHDGPDVWRS